MLDKKSKPSLQAVITSDEPPLAQTKSIKRLNLESQMNELLNIVKLVYMDTERTMKGIESELEIYDSMIARARDADLKDKYMLEQARASQKSAVSAKLLTQLINALDRMRVLTDSAEDKGKQSQIVFVNDMSEKKV